MQLKSFIFAIAFLIFSGVTRAQEELFFGPCGDLATLKMERESFTKDGAARGALTKTLYFQIDPAACSLYRVGGGYHYLQVGDLKPATKPGEPQLPMKTFRVILPRESEVCGVEVVSGNYVIIENQLNLVPTPQPVLHLAGKASGGELKPRKGVYSLESYFPGRLVSYYTGTDREKRYVFVRLYPLQYAPKTKELLLITSATINLYYQ